MKKSTVLRTRNPNSPINFVIHNSNVTVYGLKDIEIKQIKYVYPIQVFSSYKFRVHLYAFFPIIIHSFVFFIIYKTERNSNDFFAINNFQGVWTGSKENKDWNNIIYTDTHIGSELQIHNESICTAHHNGRC